MASSVPFWGHQSVILLAVAPATILVDRVFATFIVDY